MGGSKALFYAISGASTVAGGGVSYLICEKIVKLKRKYKDFTNE